MVKEKKKQEKHPLPVLYHFHEFSCRSPHKAWFPYRCICRVCRTKKIHRTDTALWKPPVQMLNTKETTDTTIWKPGSTTLTTSTIKTESTRLLTEKVRNDLKVSQIYNHHFCLLLY